MIQRIQTVYLLLATLFMFLFYIFPVSIFITDLFTYEFHNCHITHPENIEVPVTLIPLAAIPLLSGLISFVTIFLFKNRKLQIKLGKINMLVILSVLGLTVYYFIKISNLLGGEVKYGIAGIFPVLAFIMIILANKAIKKDEELVRAADRIR